MSHFITKCKECNVTITQCRCMDNNKTVKWDICDTCKKPVQAVSVLRSHGED